jgi:methyltransferase-like protein/cyclopropane fatty-acyl-phospholipid synthase-like methyltransferase
LKAVSNQEGAKQAVSELSPTSYDEIPYTSYPLPHTHPSHLSAMALIYGMSSPPPIEACQVLELGCASGGNLIPMALGLPDSRFVGIDLSPIQIAEGTQRVSTLGLNNMELRTQSILDVDDGWGRFDYIICHGVFSWVPEPVQTKILSICSRNLSPQGVAYISYNTYPGWHLRGLVREMLGFHVRRFSEPRDQIQQARSFLDFLVSAVPHPDSPYPRLLQQEAKLLETVSDTYLYHEHLEEVNRPLYFHQFCEQAKLHGLRYLGEATFYGLMASLPPETNAAIHEMASNLIEREQYLDFVTCRTFRKTLLCHEATTLKPFPPSETLTAISFSALARPNSAEVDVGSDLPEVFATEGEVTLSTNRPLVKAVLSELHEVRPQDLSLAELQDRVQRRLGSTLERDPAWDGTIGPLADVLLRLLTANLVEPHHLPAPFAIRPGPRPAVSPLVRLQALEGPIVTNLRHRPVLLNDLYRFVASQLDGTRDRNQLLARLQEKMAEGGTTLYHQDQPVDDPAVKRQYLESALDECLDHLARMALLPP